MDVTYATIAQRAMVASMAGDTGERCFLCGEPTGLTPSDRAMLCRACYRWYICDDEYE